MKVLAGTVGTHCALVMKQPHDEELDSGLGVTALL
jgi:hypothetical protein